MDIRTVLHAKKRLLILIVLAAAAVGLGAAYWLWGEPREHTRQLAALSQPKNRMQILGLRFYGMNQGRRVIAIKADRFTLGKGKIGFFSTGMTQAATIDNARIDLYATPQARRGSDAEIPPKESEPGNALTVSENGGRPAAPALSGSPSAVSPSTEVELDFGDLFANETFSTLLPTKSIVAIEVAPITILLHGSRDIVTQVTATAASIRLRDQVILFSGGVRVTTGGAELTAEQLVFDPRAARFQTDKPFTLKKGARTLAGTGLSTDLFLRRR
jgi:hypothetical protein